MKLINYITFSSNQEFIDFQLENSPEIYQVQPLMLSAGMNSLEKDLEGSKNLSGNINLNVGIFVTYLTESE